MGLVWQISFCYALFWGVGAIEAARQGRFVNPLAWFAVPLVFPISAIENFVALLKDLRSAWKRILTAVGPILVGGLAVKYLARYGWARIVGYCLIAVIGLVMLVAVGFLVPDVVRWVRGWWFHFAVGRKLTTPLSRDDLFSVLQNSITDGMRARVLSEVRISGLIRPTPETIADIHARLLKEQDLLSAVRFRQPSKLLFCDELCRVLDQLRKQVPDTRKEGPIA
jgi:hypothetical protein